MSFGTDIQKALEDQLHGTFPNPHKRIKVWAETDKYRWKEDESVWNQKRGNTAPQYEAHFDGEFVCFIDSSKGMTYNIIEFLEAIKNLYRSGKIFVHPEMYQIIQAEKEAKQREKDTVIIPSASTAVEKMIANTLTKSAKKRGKKVIQQ